MKKRPRDKTVQLGKFTRSFGAEKKKKKKSGIAARPSGRPRHPVRGLVVLGLEVLAACWLNPRSREPVICRFVLIPPTAIDSGGDPSQLSYSRWWGRSAGASHTRALLACRTVGPCRRAWGSRALLSMTTIRKHVKNVSVRGKMPAVFLCLWSWQLERLPGCFGGI